MSTPSYSISPSQLSKLRYSPVDAVSMQFDRDEMFKELRMLLKSKQPDFKLLYGYLAPPLTKDTMLLMTMGVEESASINTRFAQIDYTLVYEYQNEKLHEPMVYIWNPVFFSSKSLNTMAYYAYHGKTGEFLSDYYANNIYFPKKILDGYLSEIVDLDTRKYKIVKDPRTGENHRIESDRYWTKPEFKEKVVCAITEMCAQYNPERRG